MACPKCQCETVASANFCHRCGAMLRPFCIPCRLELPSDSHFCYRCGHSMGVQAPSPATFVTTSLSTPPPSPPPVAIEAHKSMPTQQEGERKWVTVVFADLSGFTAMSEKMDPEKVTDLVNECFKRLGKIVYDLEGHIDKFMGDCIMALFGAPVAHENDPELAVDCALRMLDELKKINQENDLDLGISIGMNSGLVVAGGVGADKKSDYTVMGDTVNTAQRLQSSAKRGEIFVSASVYRATKRNFEFVELEPVQVKGKEKPVAVYRVKGRKQSDDVKGHLDSRIPPLIGRDMELQVIERGFSEIERHRGQIVFLSGEPGIGKSRLKLEMRRRAETKGFRWFETKCTNLNRETPYFPWLELLRKIIGLTGELTHEQALSQASNLDLFNLDKLGGTLIRDLLGLVSPTDEVIKIDGAQRKILLASAIRNLILGTAKSKPSVVYVEDIQWMDSLSRDVFSLILDAVPQYSILMSAGTRPDFTHDWARMKSFMQLSLAPLNGDQSMELVKFILGTGREPTGLRSIIENKCDGNPLFIEEMVKNLIDAQKLKKRDSEWIIEGEVSADEIPATIQGLIASRIDRLRESDKKVLQNAAVIGRRFSERLLALTLMDDSVMKSALAELRARELIYEGQREGLDITYVFHHALVQDVAYQGILAKNKKVVHGQVAAAIEKLLTEDSNLREVDWVEPLSHHYLEAGNDDKAATYFYKSGKRLKETYQNDGAIKAYSTVLELIPKIEKALGDDLGQKTQIDLCAVYLLVGKFDDAERVQNALIERAKAKGDEVLLTNGHRVLGEINRKRGNFEQALLNFKDALEVSMRASDFETQINVWKGLANTYKDLHDEPKALEIFGQGLSAARALKKTELIAQYLNDIATVYLNQNNMDQAERYLSESLQYSLMDSNLRSLSAASTINLGLTHHLRGNLQEAASRYKGGAMIAEEIGDLKNIVIAKNNLAEVLIEFERFEDALTEVDRTSEICKESGNRWQWISAMIFKGYALSRLGKREEGESILEAMVEEAAEKKFWNFYCDAVFYLARLAVLSDDWAQAETYLRNALAKMKGIKNQGLTERAENELKKLIDQRSRMTQSL